LTAAGWSGALKEELDVADVSETKLAVVILGEVFILLLVALTDSAAGLFIAA
jgi:hypothetical protein